MGFQASRTPNNAFVPYIVCLSTAARSGGGLSRAKAQACALPPFGRVARLIVRGPEPEAARNYLNLVADALRKEASPEVRLMGPAEAPIAKIRDLHRFHLQIRASSPAPLHDAIRAVLPQFPVPGELELAIDIDPISVL